MISLLSGHRPRRYFTDARVHINIAPEVRERLDALLDSDAFMGSSVSYSAFIDRACESAETEYAEKLREDRE